MVLGGESGRHPAGDLVEHFFKLPGVFKLPNAERFAAWFVVSGDATADEIHVVRSVLGAMSCHQLPSQRALGQYCYCSPSTYTYDPPCIDRHVSSPARPPAPTLSRGLVQYRGISLIRKRTTRKRTPGPYRRPMPRDISGSPGGGRFLMREAPRAPAVQGVGSAGSTAS